MLRLHGRHDHHHGRKPQWRRGRLWIQNEDNKEILGLLIPSAIFISIGGFIFVVSRWVCEYWIQIQCSPILKRSGKAMGVGITLFIMGLPLFIVGSLSPGEDRMVNWFRVRSSWHWHVNSVHWWPQSFGWGPQKDIPPWREQEMKMVLNQLDCCSRRDKDEVWMKEAEFDGQRLNGLIDHQTTSRKRSRRANRWSAKG